MAHGYGSRVMCTEHQCSRAVLAKSIVMQCFLPTRPVNTDARYTLPVSMAHVHGCHFGHPWTWPMFLASVIHWWPTWPVNAGARYTLPVSTAREHGCHCGHLWTWPMLAPVIHWWPTWLVNTGVMCPWPMDMGVQNDVCLHGPWTRVVCIKLKDDMQWFFGCQSKLLVVCL